MHVRGGLEPKGTNSNSITAAANIMAAEQHIGNQHEYECVNMYFPMTRMQKSFKNVFRISRNFSRNLAITTGLPVL